VIEHTPNLPVQRIKGFCVIAKPLVKDFLASVVHVLDAMPTIALLLYPIRSHSVVLTSVFHRLGTGHLHILVPLLIVWMRPKGAMDVLVREIHEEGVFTLPPLQPLQSSICDHTGVVAVKLLGFPVDVKSRVEVFSLPPKCCPVIEATPRLSGSTPHVPLSKECSLIPVLLQSFRKKVSGIGDPALIIDNSMPMGMLTS
jgi:hypothetical protein